MTVDIFRLFTGYLLGLRFLAGGVDPNTVEASGYDGVDVPYHFFSSTDLGTEPNQEFLILIPKAANSLPLRLFAAILSGLGIRGLNLVPFSWLGLG